MARLHRKLTASELLPDRPSPVPVNLEAPIGPQYGHRYTEGARRRATPVRVRHIALFGSLARGEANAASDIDILVDLQPGAPIGVFEYVGLVQFIEDLFPIKVDVANRSRLKAHVRPNAEREAVFAF